MSRTLMPVVRVGSTGWSPAINETTRVDLKIRIARPAIPANAAK
jgi:hypothetical protein